MAQVGEGGVCVRLLLDKHRLLSGGKGAIQPHTAGSTLLMHVPQLVRLGLNRTAASRNDKTCTPCKAALPNQQPACRANTRAKHSPLESRAVQNPCPALPALSPAAAPSQCAPLPWLSGQPCSCSTRLPQTPAGRLHHRKPAAALQRQTRPAEQHGGAAQQAPELRGTAQHSTAQQGG